MDQFDKDQEQINEEASEQQVQSILQGQMTDEEIAPNKSTWDTERPRIPEKDLKKCAKVVLDLVELTKFRMAKDICP